MSVVDTIKKSVLENFTGTVSVGAMLISLLLAFAIGLFIVYVYRKTYTGVVYSKAYSLCIIMLAMVTAMIIRTISSNISLSLGMVGALSIVRFRTAIKERIISPAETVPVKLDKTDFLIVSTTLIFFTPYLILLHIANLLTASLQEGISFNICAICSGNTSLNFTSKTCLPFSSKLYVGICESNKS